MPGFPKLRWKLWEEASWKKRKGKYSLVTDLSLTLCQKNNQAHKMHRNIQGQNLALSCWACQRNWGFRQPVHSIYAAKSSTSLRENLLKFLFFCCTVRRVPLRSSIPACTPRTHLFSDNWAINDTKTAEQQDLLLNASLCICRSTSVSLSQSPCQSQLQSWHHKLPPCRSFHSRATQEPIKRKDPARASYQCLLWLCQCDFTAVL